MRGLACKHNRCRVDNCASHVSCVLALPAPERSEARTSAAHQLHSALLLRCHAWQSGVHNVYALTSQVLLKAPSVLLVAAAP